ncbi:MAG: MFS transporter [Acidimicrobiales bacterium]
MRGRRRGASRPLTWLLVAQAISLTGSRVSFIAVPWLVLETTGSAAQTGLVAFAEMLPYVLACALGGPIIDQRGPRRMSIHADAASVVVVSVVPLLYRVDLLPLGALLAVIAVAGALRGFGDTAKRAIFPLAVEVSDVDMTRATGLHDGVDRLTYLLGGALGGALIAWLGPANVLLFDAASFSLAALVVTAKVRVALAAQAVDEREPYGAALRAGFRYVRQDRLLLAIVLAVLATNLLDQAYFGVFVPVWVHEVLDSPRALGLVFGAFGLGAVLGNLVFTALAPRLPRFATFSICFFLAGAPHILVMSMTDSVVVVAITVLASGLLGAAINPTLAAVIYERIPRHLQARVLGLLRAVGWAGIPLGGLLGGLLVEGLGLRAALGLVGSLYLLVTVVPFVMPAWREIDARQPTQLAGRDSALDATATALPSPPLAGTPVDR